MTTPGYPDYTRLSLSSGVLLYGNTSVALIGNALFTGYVGNFQYLDTFWNKQTGTDHYTMRLDYYTDDTFATLFASQLGLRDSSSVGWKQYAPLSPWLKYTGVPSLGSLPNTADVALYGTNAKATGGKLASTHTPFFSYLNAATPNGTTTVGTFRIQPGPATFNWYIGTPDWIVTVQYWNQAAAAYQDWFIAGGQGLPQQGCLAMNLPDAPTQVVITNGSGAAQDYEILIQSTSD